jgi:cytochrome P450
VPAERIVDHDVFVVDAPDGDFAGAMVRLRDSGIPRLFWTKRNGGHWVATDGETIRMILEDAERFSSKAMRVPKAANPDPPMMPLMIDPPDLVHVRRLLAPAFTPAEVRRLEHRARAVCIELNEGFAPRGHCEFVSEFAQHMPIVIFMSMLDLPMADREVILGIVDRIVRPDVPETRMRGFGELADYCFARIAERRAHPGDDLVSHLLETDLTDDELVASVVLLLNAGHEASVNVFGNGLNALLTHPDQQERIASGEVPMVIALEELIRFDAPLQLYERTAVEDVELGGVEVRTGQTVACLMGSANRDDAVFAQADRLDVGRDPNPHVGFGMGLHFCLGAPLARLELEITFRRLLERFPRLTLAGDPPRRPTWVLRGFQSIEVDCV